MKGADWWLLRTTSPLPPQGFTCLVLGYRTLTHYYPYRFSLDITISLVSVRVCVCEEKCLFYCLATCATWNSDFWVLYIFLVTIKERASGTQTSGQCERDHSVLLEARHPLHHSLQQHTEETGETGETRARERERESERNKQEESMQGEGLGVGEGLSWLRKSLFKINT